MKISAISNINFKQAAAPEKAANKEPKEENKHTGLSRNAKTAIGSGLVAAGLLAIYFVSRSSKAAKAAEEAVSDAKSSVNEQAQAVAEKGENAVTEISEKIKTALKDFKSDITDIKVSANEKLQNGTTRLTYSGKNAEGHDINDILFFNKNGEITARMIEQITPNETIKISYKGNDKALLAKPDEMPEGRYNPKYFQRQITKYNMEKHGNDNIPDSVFYSQSASVFDNKGNYQDYVRRYKTDEKKTKIKTTISSGTVDIKQNPETKIHEFDWNTKKELNGKYINYAFTDDHKLNAYFTHNSKINGEEQKDDKVILRYRGWFEKGKDNFITYDTPNELKGHEPLLYKGTPEFKPKTEPQKAPDVNPKPETNPKSEVNPAPAAASKGFELGSDEAKAEFEKLDPKIKEYLNNSFTTECDDPTHRKIDYLKNGVTKITYSGTSENGEPFSEMVFFNKNRKGIRQISKSVENNSDTNEYKQTINVKFKESDEKNSTDDVVSIVRTFDQEKNLLKTRTRTRDGKPWGKVTYCYDSEFKPVGVIEEKDNLTILKLFGKKFGQVFENMDDLLKNTDRSEFQIL